MARRINWEDARNYLRRIREEQVRDGETVVRLWNEVLKKDPSKLGDEMWIVYEQVCIAALDCQKQDIAYENIVVLDANFPNSVRVNRLRGMLYEAQGRWKKAEEVYAKILEQDSANMFVKKRLVAVAKAQNDISTAIEKLNEYLKDFMTDFEAWMELCDLYLSQLDYSKAAFCMEELIMSNPHNHLFHQKFAEIKYSQCEYEQARSYFAQSLRLNPNNVRSLYGFFLSAYNQALLNKGKDKQTNVKFAAWAAQQLKEKYECVQAPETTAQTKVLETIDKLLHSLTDK